MSSIGIYMEGGGDFKNGRAALRLGMDDFLGSVKSRVRALSWQWKLACWGGRAAAFRRFRTAVKNNEHELTLLLVDAEAPVFKPVQQHLADRDKWKTQFAPESNFHLMAQTMETWMVADPDALAEYYGDGFRPTALPRRQDLELEPRRDLQKGLERATQNTRKGAYHKIRHASSLLRHLDPGVVRSRCRHCDRLFRTLEDFILEAQYHQ